MSHYAELPTLRLHYLDHPGGRQPLVLLPGLTANAHAFDGLVGAGLSPRHRVLAPDLRGRGLSDKPASGYSLAAHAADVLGLLDRLGLEAPVVGGHSFGALVSLYLAAHYPERVSRLILIDIDTVSAVHPRTRELIGPSLDRLGQVFPSWEAYLEAMRRAPFYNGWWDPALDGYYRADVRVNPDGSVQPQTHPAAIAEVMEHVIAEDWQSLVAAVRCPSLVLHASGSYGPPGAPPIVQPEHARAMAAALPACRAIEVPGNHMTMLFGEGARRIVGCIEEFLAEA